MMSCHCILKKDAALIIEKKAALSINLNLQRINYNLPKLIERSNFLASHRRSEADEIIQPFITAILDYDEAFNKNCSQALGLVEQVAENDPVAMASFRACMEDISVNIDRIEKIGKTSESELNTFREETFTEIRNLSTQIQELELQRVSLETEINFLREDILILNNQLNILYEQYWACRIILLPGCDTILRTIKAITSNQQQKKEELRNQIAKLTLLNARLTQLNQDKQSLEADYNTSVITSAEIHNAHEKCIYILNNITGIEQSLEGINPDEITILLKMKLMALQRNWDDLVETVKLLNAALTISLIGVKRLQGE